MTHVFIVSQETFNIHLQYMFAGTGARPKENQENEKIEFLSNPKAKISYQRENNLIGLFADTSRIREGDKIIFYLQQHDGKEGKFYGVFKSKGKSFFDENDESNYLNDELGRNLTFRVQIEADEVYPEGVTEHEYLDDIEGKEHPYEMCWSLIYRKLKANRGCTMITEYETKDLINKLKVKSKNKTITGKNFKFNYENDTIEELNTDIEYKGRKEEKVIKDRLLEKYKKNQAFESHLQAHIIQNFDKEPLKKLIFSKENLGKYWIGNEVSCGVGMQRIDIMTIQEDEKNIYIRPIELKCWEIYEEIITRQIPWYIKWCLNYIVPTYNQEKNIYVIPTIITRESENKSIYKKYQKVEINHKKSNTKIRPIEYIEFKVDKDEIQFDKIK